MNPQPQPHGREPVAAREGGFVTIWALGLTVILFAVGGLVFDLWRGLSERRELAAAADAAANAAANAIDEDYYRSTGQVRLDPQQAEAFALDSLNQQQDPTLTDARVDVERLTVTVTLHGQIRLTLLRLIEDEPLAVSVQATAEFRSLP